MVAHAWILQTRPPRVATRAHAQTDSPAQTVKYVRHFHFKKTISSFQWIFKLFSLALPCDSNPTQCLNGGTCSNDNTGGYSCACETGFTGATCETGWCFILQKIILILKLSTRPLLLVDFYWVLKKIRTFLLYLLGFL